MVHFYRWRLKNLMIQHAIVTKYLDSLDYESETESYDTAEAALARIDNKISNLRHKLCISQERFWPSRTKRR